jgi:hypothetical protein
MAGVGHPKGLSSQIDSLNIAGFGGFRQPNKALTIRAWPLLPLFVGLVHPRIEIEVKEKLAAPTGYTL